MSKTKYLREPYKTIFEEVSDIFDYALTLEEYYNNIIEQHVKAND